MVWRCGGRPDMPLGMEVARRILHYHQCMVAHEPSWRPVSPLASMTKPRNWKRSLSKNESVVRRRKSPHTKA